MYISKARPFQLPPVRNTKRMNPHNPAGGCSIVQLVEPNLRYKDKTPVDKPTNLTPAYCMAKSAYDDKTPVYQY